MIPFTIDGQRFETSDLSQRAADLLRLAGLDPAVFDLGELEGKERPQTKRFAGRRDRQDPQGRTVCVDPPERACRLMQPGERGFTDAMAQLGLAPRVEFGLVICCFTPVEGARAGESIEVGVSVDELAPWPQAPPHWIHLRQRHSLPANEQPAVHKAGVVDAQPQRCWVGRCRASSRLDQPPASGPRRDDLVTGRASVRYDRCN